MNKVGWESSGIINILDNLENFRHRKTIILQKKLH